MTRVTLIHDNKRGLSIVTKFCAFLLLPCSYNSVDFFVAGPKGCHRDRHENIGKGHIGLAGFRRVMNDPHFDNIPMILETPGGVGYDKEIKILHNLCHD